MKIKMFFSLIFIFAAAGGLFLLGQQEQPEKIAIASDGETKESQVAEQGGRCDWFLFFNAEGELLETAENPYKNERGGAGVSSADFLADKKATVFVAGMVGGKMRDVLDSHEIEYISFSGTVEEALSHILQKNE